MGGFGFSKAEMEVIKEFQKKEQMESDMKKFKEI